MSAARARVLLLSFEGLPGTVIDSQVLLHARDYAAIGIADFEIWAVACRGPLYRRSVARRADAERLSQTRVEVPRGVRPGLPLSGLLNALLLLPRLWRERERFTHVHGRTDYGAMVAGLLARVTGHTAIWDCRGDAEAELVGRLGRGNPVARAVAALRRRSARFTTSLAGRLCHRAIFVSEPLRAARRGALGAKPSVVIPCVASERTFYYDPDLRAATRATLGFEPDARVYVFSGSMAHYQCFARTVRVFEGKRAVDPGARLLVVTPDREAALAELGPLATGAALVRSAGIEEMNALLNAADCAFMIREPSPINAGASPTKFAEYCLTGLPVIMTDAVVDSAAMARRLGTFVECAGDDGGPEPEVDRTAVMEQARRVLTKSACADAYRRAYDTASARCAPEDGR